MTLHMLRMKVVTTDSESTSPPYAFVAGLEHVPATFFHRTHTCFDKYGMCMLLTAAVVALGFWYHWHCCRLVELFEVGISG